MENWAMTPFEISSYDNPETIRFRKYATGIHRIVHGTEVETGLIPKEVVWQRGEAKLYHYEPTQEKKYPFPPGRSCSVGSAVSNRRRSGTT